MTLVTFDDGKVVLRDGKVGTEESCCCCPPCNAQGFDTTTQPDVSLTSDCPCEAGTLDGDYAFDVYDDTIYPGGQWSWRGDSTCDYSTFFDPVSPVYVEINCTCGVYTIRVSTYVLDSKSVTGTLTPVTFTKGAADEFQGTFDVDIFDLFDNFVCTITLTFG